MHNRDASWFDNIDDARFGVPMGGGVLIGVHPVTACAGAPCCIHSPSEHPLRTAPLNWRADRRIKERICRHGVGHDDPDDLTYRRSIGSEASGIHACCGCCRLPDEGRI